MKIILLNDVNVGLIFGEMFGGFMGFDGFFGGIGERILL
jgi:hypothetical protein